MGGPIVRTGATPEFASGWDRIFGKGDSKKGMPKKAASKPAAKAVAKKTTKKKPAKSKK